MFASSHTTADRSGRNRISQPFDARPVGPNRKLPPAPLHLPQPNERFSQYGNGTARPREHSLSPDPRSACSLPPNWKGQPPSSGSSYTTEDEDLPPTPYTPLYLDSGYPSPCFSISEDLEPSTPGLSIRSARSPTKVMFAAEPVSKVHTPSTKRQPVVKDKEKDNGRRSFFGWKKKSGKIVGTEEEPSVGRLRSRSVEMDRAYVQEPPRQSMSATRPTFERPSMDSRTLLGRQAQPQSFHESPWRYQGQAQSQPPVRPSSHTHIQDENKPVRAPRRRTVSGNPRGNRETSIVQRSDSEFSLHSSQEGWNETSDVPGQAIEERDQESPKYNGFAELEKRRKDRSERKDPRVSVFLPGSSFNLGLDFGYIGSDTDIASMLKRPPALPEPIVPQIKEDRFEGINSVPVTPDLDTLYEGASRGWSTMPARPSARTANFHSLPGNAYLSPEQEKTSKSNNITGRNRNVSDPSPRAVSSYNAQGVIDLSSPVTTFSPAVQRRSSSRRTSTPSPNRRKVNSMLQDSPTLPLDHPPRWQSAAFEDRTSSSLREELSAPSGRRSPTMGIPPSGSIASLLSMSLGMDEATDVPGGTEEIPMFRVIPATPIRNLEEFEAKKKAEEIEREKGFQATPRMLEDAVDLDADKGISPSASTRSISTLEDSPFPLEPKMPEIRPLVVNRSGSEPRIVVNRSRLAELANGSHSLPSLTSMSTASSNSSLSTLGDADEALEGMMMSLNQTSRQPVLEDPLTLEKQLIDEQIRNWSSRSLASAVPDAEAYRKERRRSSVLGLGFELEDERSVTPTNLHHIIPLKTSGRDNYATPILQQGEATFKPFQDTTPRATRRSFYPHEAEQMDQATWDERRISGSTVSESIETDSVMSDIDDLEGASISVVASKFSGWCSPRQVEFGDRPFEKDCEGDVEEVESEIQHTEENEGDRWDDADEDEYDVGWAM